MDLNLVVLCGRLAATPELRELDSGSAQLRLLVVVRSEVPVRRLDLIPVVVCEPPDEILELTANEWVWISGMLQRRFWEEPIHGGRTSSVQVMAHQIDRRPLPRGMLTG